MSLLDKIGAGLTKFGASPVGKGTISFLRDQPITEIENEMARNELLRQEGRIRKGQADTIENQLNDRGSYRELLRVAMGDDPEAAQQAVNKMIETNPDLGLKMDEVLNVRNQRDLERNAAEASELLTLPPEQRGAAIQRMMQDESIGIDNELLASLGTMHPKEANLTLMAVKGRALTEQQRQVAERGGDAPGELQTHNALVEQSQSSDPNISGPAKIALGLEPRAVGSGAITTATQPGLTDAVASSQEIIRARTKFAEMTASARSQTIDKAFTKIAKIDENLRNLDRAITAIDDGASTGAVESRFFPTLRESTVALEQVQKALGLDVVGSVTFGQLSESELELALTTALPTGLQPGPLREWLVARKTAQGKLRNYLNEQVEFLHNGGTQAEFLMQQAKKSSGAAEETQTESIDPSLLEFMPPEDRALFEQ